MAERVAPPGEKPTDDDPPPNALFPTHHAHDNSFGSGTYVVQVPKEQIYRIPTAENAKLAEKYRNPPPRNRPGLSFLIRICGCILFLAILLGLIALLIYFIVNPHPPQFTIDSIKPRKTTTSHHHRFIVLLTSENTNPRMEILYRQGGSASLAYKLEEIGSGEPQPIQSSKRSTTFKLSLSDSEALLPKKIRKSMHGKGPKGGLPLSLSVIIPVKLKMIGMSLWATKLVGDCHMKVSKLTAEASILSQSCTVKFG